MSKGMNQGEALDHFLDDLIADPAAIAPEEVDTATATTLRAIVHVERPTRDSDALDQAQTRVWNRVMAAANHAQAQPRKSGGAWLAWRPGLPRLAAIATAMLVLVGLGSLAIFGGTERAGAAEILSRAEKVAQDGAASGLASYRGTIKGSGTNGSPGQEAVAHYRQEIWFQTPGSERLEFYLEDLILPTPGPQETPVPTSELLEGVSIRVTDGRTAWAYNTANNMVAQYDPDTLDSAGPEFGATGLAGLLSTANEEYEARLVGSEPVLGRETHVVELVPREGTFGAQLWTRRTLWIDKETYLTLKEVDQDERFARENSWQFTGLEINVPLDPSLFTFTPPPGAEIFDARPKPTPTGGEIDRTWRNLAGKADFQLYRPTHIPAKLQPQLPGNDSGGTTTVTQKFSSKASPTALFIFQSKAGLPFEGRDGEVAQAGPYTGRYLERDFVRILVVKIGNTEVLLQGQAEVTKADLLEIAASLQPVEIK